MPSDSRSRGINDVDFDKARIKVVVEAGERRGSNLYERDDQSGLTKNGMNTTDESR